MKITVRDYKKMVLDRERKNKKYKTYWLIYAAVAVPFFLLMMAFVFVHIATGEPPSGENWNLYELMTFIIVLPPVFLVTMPYINMEKTLVEDKHKPDTDRHIRYDMSQDGIMVSEENAQYRLLWDDIQKLDVLKHSYVMHAKGDRLLLYPKKRFLNRLQERDFRDWCRNYIDKSRIQL